MKNKILALVILATSAASAKTVECEYNSNSDFIMYLNFDSNGTLTQINLTNQDWGGAGVFAPQALEKVDQNNYVVTTAANNGVAVGTALHLDLTNHVMTLNNDPYTCN